MKIERHLIVPEFIWDKKLVPYDELDAPAKRMVRAHSQHESVLRNRPYFRRVLENTFTVMKMHGAFTKDEYLDVTGKAKIKGFVAQWNVKRAHGGGRGARSNGKIDFGKTQVILDILKELDIHDEFMSIPIEKRTNRIQKIIGEIHDFKTAPRVKIGHVAEDYDGIIWARPGWMKENGVEMGAKTTLATKGLIVPLEALECTIIDLLVTPEENKLNLSEEKLSCNIKWIPRLGPNSLFSRNLKRKFTKAIGRNPRARWDLQALLNMTPKTDLTKEKTIFETGKVTKEDIESMFGYEKGGEIVIRPVGRRILAGESIFHPDVWLEFEKPFIKMILDKLQPTIHGLYGVVLPKSMLRVIDNDAVYFKAYVTRFPWILPIKTTIGLWKDVLFVIDDLWKAFGGDYDGDQGAAFDVRSMDTDLDWDRDSAWLKRIIKMPTKEAADFKGMDEDQVIARQLEQYAACGSVYNNGKIVVDAAREEGLGYRELIELDTKIAAQDVQPFIDGFKYKLSENVPQIADLCKKYHIDMKDIKKITEFFRVLRGRNRTMEKIVGLAQLADPESKGFYERIVSIFKNWKKGEYTPVRRINKKFEKEVKSSYVKYKGDVEARYGSIRRYLHTEDAINATIRNCYERRDVPFALYLETKRENCKEVIKEKSWN